MTDKPKKSSAMVDYGSETKWSWKLLRSTIE